MKRLTEPRRHFASDNYAGICPEAWNALAEANQGHVVGYGDDPWTSRAADLIREVFETDCEVFFVFNGTAANSLALAALSQSYHSLLCHETAHIETHECGAPELFSHGAKVLLMPGEHGKIAPASIREMVTRRSDIHYPKPRAVSLTQVTEWGTIYSPQELRAIGEVAKELNLRIHMDGARFANAVAALGVTPKEITWQAGVDVLAFGGTKNGTQVGEALVFFNRELANEFDYRCKQAGQLASKMRFVSAPWVGMLRDGAWLRHAGHANRMAQLLYAKLQGLPEVKFTAPVESNMVFLELPKPVISAMHGRGWHFYVVAGECGCRLVCSWDTTTGDINAFVRDLRNAMSLDSPAPQAKHRASQRTGSRTQGMKRTR